MKSIAIPKFSERYQALVDAERQYVVNNLHQARGTGRQESKGVATRQTGTVASDSGVAAALRLAHTQNGADKSR